MSSGEVRSSYATVATSWSFSILAVDTYTSLMPAATYGTPLHTLMG